MFFFFFFSFRHCEPPHIFHFVDHVIHSVRKLQRLKLFLLSNLTFDNQFDKSRSIVWLSWSRIWYTNRLWVMRSMRIHAVYTCCGWTTNIFHMISEVAIYHRRITYIKRWNWYGILPFFFVWNYLFIRNIPYRIFQSILCVVVWRISFYLQFIWFYDEWLQLNVFVIWWIKWCGFYFYPLKWIHQMTVKCIVTFRVFPSI